MSIQVSVTSVADLFNKYGSQREDSYISSMAYYLLTGRKGASFYTQGDSSLVVCQHPHIADRLMVFPEIGQGDGSLTCKVLQALSTGSKTLQLARYTDVDFDLLVAAGNRNPDGKLYTLAEIEEHAMDWKYPLHILNTEKVAAMQGRSFEKLRNKYNKVHERVDVVPLSNSKASTIMRASLMYWAGSMIHMEKETGHDLMEYYTTLFQKIEAMPDLFDGFAVICDGEPAGFTIWDAPVGDTANGIAGLSRLKIKGLSEFQTVTACAMLQQQGVAHYNIGGSESEGLNRHKLEYKPEKSIQLRSYEVIARNALAGVSMHTLVP